uniref:Uncharacterized protein n=1 Tax=Strombidium inclinatum TaxID=197538 RepID=A0A7S3IG04_9SPIT
MNIFHTMIMFSWSNNWADQSVVLELFTLFHYVQSFCSVLLVYRDSYYMYMWKDLRALSMWAAMFTIICYSLAFMFEIYLIFYSRNVIGILFSVYLGYVLLIFITVLPESLVILIEEVRLNILARDETLSVGGKYFSFMEFSLEDAGLYGSDTLLHDYNVEVLTNVKNYFDTLDWGSFDFVHTALDFALDQMISANTLD